MDYWQNHRICTEYVFRHFFKENYRLICNYLLFSSVPFIQQLFPRIQNTYKLKAKNTVTRTPESDQSSVKSSKLYCNRIFLTGKWKERICIFFPRKFVFFSFFGNKLTDRWHFAIDPSVTSLLVRFTRGTVTIAINIYMYIITSIYAYIRYNDRKISRGPHAGKCMSKSDELGTRVYLPLFHWLRFFFPLFFFSSYYNVFFPSKKGKFDTGVRAPLNCRSIGNWKSTVKTMSHIQRDVYANTHYLHIIIFEWHIQQPEKRLRVSRKHNID